MQSVITCTVINGRQTTDHRSGAHWCMPWLTDHSLAIASANCLLTLIDHEVVHPSITLQHVVFEYANDFPVVHNRYTNSTETFAPTSSTASSWV